MRLRGIMLGAAAAAGLMAGGASAQPVEGFGNNVPLSFAVRQIVPPDMLVNFDERVNQGARVSWRGGQDWRAVLEALAAQQGAGVSYMGQLIRIHPAAPGQHQAAAAPASPAQAQAPSRGLSTGGLVLLPSRGSAPPAPAPVQAEPVRSAPAPVQAEAPRAAPPEPRVASAPAQPERPSEPAPRRGERAEARGGAPVLRNTTPSLRQVVTNGTWRVARGETLDQVLGDWAERAGWTLVFNSPVVYEIQAGAEFQGEFVEAVAALVRSVQARPVPVAQFFRGNNVLVVSNNVNAN